ncbi:hypothetical protein ADUPG1_009408, partial [Aduncisulcus paluster]
MSSIDERILRNVLRSANLYEHSRETKKRQIALKEIESIVIRWVNRKYDEHTKLLKPQHLAKLEPFGSFRLGVQSPNSDIDTLCVLPCFVDRDDIFDETTGLVPILRSHSKVVDFKSVPGAYVPIIKMIFDSVDIDLIFAIIRNDRIDDSYNLGSNEILRDIDEKSIRALNGPRVSDKILSVLPNKTVFKMVLRAVRLWAKKRGIYGNVLGYFGGVNWAIVVANVCKEKPKAVGIVVLKEFFKYCFLQSMSFSKSHSVNFIENKIIFPYMKKLKAKKESGRSLSDEKSTFSYHHLLKQSTDLRPSHSFSSSLESGASIGPTDIPTSLPSSAWALLLIAASVAHPFLTADERLLLSTLFPTMTLSSMLLHHMTHMYNHSASVASMASCGSSLPSTPFTPRFLQCIDTNWRHHPCLLGRIETLDEQGKPHDTMPGLFYNPHDKTHVKQIMQIITPAYPAQNSTFNATASSVCVMRSEWARGYVLCEMLRLEEERKRFEEQMTLSTKKHGEGEEGEGGEGEDKVEDKTPRVIKTESRVKEEEEGVRVHIKSETRMNHQTLSKEEEEEEKVE